MKAIHDEVIKTIPLPLTSREIKTVSIQNRTMILKLENFIALVNAPKITQEFGSFQYDEIEHLLKKMSFKYILTILIETIKNKKTAL